MSEPVELSVILPACLEEENLRLLLPRIKKELDACRILYEIVVVDTTTPMDGTEGVASEVGARCVRRAPGNCFGDAVRTGLREALGNQVIFMDADGSHAPELLPALLREGEEYDVVIASRYVDGGCSDNAPVLRMMSRILNFSYSVLLGLRVKDVSNSFKFYRTSVLRGINLRCENFDVVEELLFKIRREHPDARMKEIPCTFKRRMFGQTKRNLVWFMISYLVTMVRLRFFTG